MTTEKSQLRIFKHSIANEDRHLYFNPASAAFLVTNKLGSSIIDDFIMGRGSHKFVNTVIARGLFDRADPGSYGKVPERLILEITTGCNLRCKTCYMAASKPQPDELTLVEIKRLLEEASKAGCKTVAIIGGEPFLREDLLPITRFALDRFEEVQISTNGTLLAREFIEKFKASKNLVIQISLDGPDAESNDRIRGKDSFGKAKEFIGLACRSGIRITLSTVLNAYNYNLVSKMCEFASEVGAQGVIFHKVHVVGRAEKFPDIMPTAEQLMHGMGMLLSMSYEYEISGRLIVDFPHNRWIRGDRLIDAAYPACHFGRAFAFVASKGDLVCCSHLRDGEFVCGNVRQRDLLEIWNTSPMLSRMRNLSVEEIPSCTRCDFKYICRASCRADALGASGSILGDPPDCDALKRYYRYVFDHYARTIDPIIPEVG
ncbi:MAG: radical SAM protein [bacterium]